MSNMIVRLGDQVHTRHIGIWFHGIIISIDRCEPEMVMVI